MRRRRKIFFCEGDEERREKSKRIFGEGNYSGAVHKQRHHLKGGGGKRIVSEPSMGPCMGQGPLKWTEIGPSNDPWMIWYEFETFCNDRFCKLKPEYIFKRIIHFFRKQNIHSKQIFIFEKSMVFIQKKINLEYSFKTNTHFFLKSRILIQKRILIF